MGQPLLAQVPSLLKPDQLPLGKLTSLQFLFIYFQSSMCSTHTQKGEWEINSVVVDHAAADKIETSNDSLKWRIVNHWFFNDKNLKLLTMRQVAQSGASDFKSI